MGLRLFFLPNFPGATFIQGAMFIPNSRVRELVNLWFHILMSRTGYKWLHFFCDWLKELAWYTKNTVCAWKYPDLKKDRLQIWNLIHFWEIFLCSSSTSLQVKTPTCSDHLGKHKTNLYQDYIHCQYIHIWHQIYIN